MPDYYPPLLTFRITGTNITVTYDRVPPSVSFDMKEACTATHIDVYDVDGRRIDAYSLQETCVLRVGDRLNITLTPHQLNRLWAAPPVNAQRPRRRTRPQPRRLRAAQDAAILAAVEEVQIDPAEAARFASAAFAGRYGRHRASFAQMYGARTSPVRGESANLRVADEYSVMGTRTGRMSVGGQPVAEIHDYAVSLEALLSDTNTELAS